MKRLQESTPGQVALLAIYQPTFFKSAPLLFKKKLGSILRADMDFQMKLGSGLELKQSIIK